MSATRPEHHAWRSRQLFRVLLGACLIVLSGCGRDFSPQDTTDRFWRAVVTGHPAKIRRYVTAADREALSDDAKILPIANFTLGRVLIDGDVATIETQLVLDGDTPLPLTIETRLVREAAAWRIDYAATVAAISTQSSLAQVIGKIGKLGDDLKQGIDQSVNEVQQALPLIESEIARLEAQIKQAMPALREKLEAFSKRLNETLQPPAEEPAAPEPARPDATIAL